MEQTTQAPVLVAVRDADEAKAALAFAVEEALRADAPLHLVHVVHRYPTNGQELVVGSAFVGPAREMLTTLALEIRATTEGRIHPTWEVVEGLVAHALVRLGQDARLVVLAGEPLSTLDRVMTGSVRTKVAARSHAPVVCVPEAWTPSPSIQGFVVAGVEDPESPGAAVETALEIAAVRGSRVRLVHALWFIEPLDDVALSRQHVLEFMALAENQLRRSVTDMLQRYGDLDISVAVVHQRPADALVAESRRAELLVLGRQDPRPPIGSQLGSVSRTVLRRALGPVMVTPARSRSTVPRPAGSL